MSEKQNRNEEIAIVGISCMLPQANDADEFWENIFEGKDCVVEISNAKWNEENFYDSNIDAKNKTSSKWIGEVNALKEFDNKFFNISPAEANNMDPDQRVLLQETWKCIEDSGISLKTLQEKRTSIIVGTAEVDTFGNQHMPEYEINAFSGKGSYYFMIPNRVSWYLGFSGESKLVETGCPSGLSALNDGVNLLKLGKSDFAIVSGVNTFKTSHMLKLMSKNGLFSADGKCKTFSADADGIVVSEGIVALLLAPLSVAKKNNYHIYGVIENVAANHVGTTFSITAPKVSAQKDLILDAWNGLNFSPDTINYIETHGTGTSLGDPIEVEALKQAYENVSNKKNFCWLGSVKPNIGHALPVSGLIGVVKILKMFENKTIPKQINISEINPLINIENSPFNITLENLPWKPENPQLPLRAGVTALGFAGVNVHAVLEQYIENESDICTSESSKEYALVLSAKTKESLIQMLNKWSEKLVKIENNHSIKNISYTLCNGREQFKYRVGCLVKEDTNLSNILSEIKEDIHEVSDNNYLLDISFINKEIIDNKLVDIIKNNIYFENELVSVATKLGISREDVFDLNSYPSDEAYYLIIATVFIKVILNITNNIEGIYLETYDNKLLALLIAEVINIEDAIKYLRDQENAKGIITRKPNIIVNFNNKVILTKDIISEKYLKYLLSEISLEFKQAGNSITLASSQWLNNIRLLYKYQRTFNKYINELNILFTKQGVLDLKVFISNENSQIDDIEDNKLKFMVLLAINIASKRLYKKWSLIPQDVFADNRLNEISELIIQGYITFESIVKLYQEEVNNKWQGAFYHSLEDILILSKSNIPQECENYNILKGISEKRTLEEFLVELWLKGATIDWNRGLDFNECKLVPLPTYCFNKKQFKYIQQEYRNNEQSKSELQIKKVDYKQANININDVGNQNVLVFSNVERVEFNNLNAKKLFYVKLTHSKKTENEQYTIQPDSLEDCIKLFNELEQIDFIPDVILVALNDSEEVKSKESYILYTFIFASNLAKCLIQMSNSSGKILFSAMGKESCQYSEGLTAFFKTLQIEYETLYFRNLTCYHQSVSDFVSTLNKEIYNFSTSEYKVTYVGLQRTIQSYTNFKPENSQQYIKENGIYILLGGFGAIGKVIAQHLVEQANVNLILCGRKAENDEICKFINSLNRGSSTVIYKSVDVSINEQLYELISDITKDFGTIDGIFNMTGYINPGYIESKSNEFLRNAIKLKVDATVILDEITKDINLDFFVNFSSISAVLGDFGLSEYVYANCFFDEFIRRREEKRKEGKRHGNSISINWPYWRDGGLRMTEKDSNRFTLTTGLCPISNEDALTAFDLIMKSKISLQCCVLYGNDKKMNEYLQEKLNLPQISQNTKDLVLDNSDLDIKEIVEQYLATVISNELSLSTDELDAEENFQSMGIDSILIHKLNRVLAKDFLGISPTIFYDCRDINEMVDYFIKTYSEDKLKNILAPNCNHTLEVEANRIQSESNNIVINEQSTINRLHVVDSTNGDSNDIAIIGMSGRFPMARSIEEFWVNLMEGKDCVSSIPETRWNIENFYDEEAKNSYKGKMNSKWGGFIDDIDQFDPLLFQISPRDAGNMDPQERILLEVVYEAFEYAGYSKKRIQNKVEGSVGVFIGNTTNGYRLLIEDEMEKGNSVTHQALPWSIANRISYVFELNGPSFVIDSACSSSLNSIVVAVENIRSGKCKMAIAGGVNLHLHPSEYILRSQLRVLSPTGKCHSFSSEADGYVPGEGIGAIILKSLKAAERDGDNILGVIKGVASNHVGHPNGYTVPSSTSQAAVIKAAIEDANISARDITFIEAHGTGTILGDPIEINGLKSAFDNYSNDNQFCAIGSAKSTIGHLEGAAGIAATIKTVLQLVNKVKVPLINCDTTNPGISFADSQFYLQKKVEPWTGYNNTLVAGVSSFGAGGSNAHIIIQNYVDKRKMSQSNTTMKYPVLISEMTDEGLRMYAQKMYNWLNSVQEGKNSNLRIEDIAYTTQVGRELLPSRICIICSTIDDLKNGLTGFLNNNQYSNVKTNLTSDKAALNKVDKIRYKDMARVAVNQGDVEELSRFAIMGIDVDWEQFNLLQNGYIIMIPTYVFDNQSYWLNIVENNDRDNTNRISSDTSKLAFLLDANISTIESQRFVRKISNKEFFINDHIIDGKTIMPGTAIIEMAIEAGNLSLTNQQVNSVEDIKYHRAIEVNDRPTELHIDIMPQDYYLVFKVYSCIEQERILCAEGKLILNASDDCNFELPSIEHMEEIDTGEYYKWLDMLGFNFKNSFKSIERMFFKNNVVMAEVSITQKDQFDKASNCTLWPPLIDGVLQSTFKLVENETEVGYVSLPVSIGKLIMYKTTKSNLIAFAQISKKHVRGNSDFIFDICVFDENGELAMEVQEYRLVKVKKSNHDSIEYEDTDAILLEVLRKIQNGEIDKNMLYKLL